MEYTYHNVVDTISDGILIIGFDGTIRFENPIAMNILGVSEESLCGKTMYHFMKEDDKNDDFFQCIIDAIFEKEKISKTVIYNRKGEERYLRLVISPVKNTDEDTAIIVVFSDITQIIGLGKKNRHLHEKLIEFIDNFVKLMIDAIDTRSHYNANHTKNMARYAENYLKWVEKEKHHINGDIKNTIMASVWLHDIGKLVIPIELMDKPTRLGDKEKDIMHRIEIGILNEKLKCAEGKADIKEADNNIKRLEEIREYIKEINRINYADDEVIRKVQDIAKIQCMNSSGNYENVLTEYELSALCIRKGTLTDEERKIIESHVVHTYNLLMKMGFEGVTENIPKWAGGHHEYLDGTGYPNGLKGDEIPKETRFITIIDIYDALTADDRPYKPAIKPDKAFHILHEMADEGKIDKALLNDFYESRAWE